MKRGSEGRAGRSGRGLVLDGELRQRRAKRDGLIADERLELLVGGAQADLLVVGAEHEVDPRTRGGEFVGRPGAPVEHGHAVVRGQRLVEERVHAALTVDIDVDEPEQVIGGDHDLVGPRPVDEREVAQLAPRAEVADGVDRDVRRAVGALRHQQGRVRVLVDHPGDRLGPAGVGAKQHGRVKAAGRQPGRVGRRGDAHAAGREVAVETADLEVKHDRASTAAADRGVVALDDVTRASGAGGRLVRGRTVARGRLVAGRGRLRVGRERLAGRGLTEGAAPDRVASRRAARDQRDDQEKHARGMAGHPARLVDPSSHERGPGSRRRLNDRSTA